MQQASYLEGGPLLWILPLYLHVNKKSDDDDDDITGDNITCNIEELQQKHRLGIISDRLLGGLN